ncbi:MAG TPA: preprotein translocase subunit SecG [Cyclobacteriaceae bacterium]|nr:preprotein translocase subunit SecG [Cyclobacteriaceae bacterium]
MYVLLISLAIVSAILLVLVVLAQNSKGGGLSSQFGGSGASNLIGVKKTGDVLERLTWGFAIAIIVFSLATNFTTPNTAAPTDELMEKAREQQTAPVIPVVPKGQAKTDSTKK